MIGSTLIEREAAALFLFSSIETGYYFELKRPCQHHGNIIKQMSLNNVIKQTDCPVSAHRWRAPFNPEQSCFDGWK